VWIFFGLMEEFSKQLVLLVRCSLLRKNMVKQRLMSDFTFASKPPSVQWDVGAQSPPVIKLGEIVWLRASEMGKLTDTL
jgi:hypothetical protein